MRIILGLVTLAVLASMAPPQARACMPGAWHPQQDVLIFWNDGTEVLVWRTLISTEPPPGSTEPLERPRGEAPLAWLLAVPARPIAYEVVEREDFEGAAAWAASHVDWASDRATGGGRGGGEGLGGLEVGETQRVGEYDVTPIQGTGEAAGTALARWLGANHFPAANPEAVRTYVAAGYTFLAVKVRVPGGVSRAELRPLAIAFRSDRIVIPVKLSAGEPAFGLTATVFSTRKPDVGSPGHGLAPQLLRVPGSRIGEGESAPVVPVTDLSYAAVIRRIPERLAARVPEMVRMKEGPLWLARLSASPLRPDASAAVPDPTLPLGEQAAEAPELPRAQPPSPSPEPEIAPSSPPAAAREGSGWCSVASSRAPLGIALVLVALAVRARRHRRRSP